MPRVITPDGRSVEIGDGQSFAIPIAVPGLDKAIADENIQRDIAFLALGDDSGMFNETIAGVEVRPLTMRHLLWLTVADSCFVTGRQPDDLFPELVKLLRIVGVPPKRKWYQRKLDHAKLNAQIIQRAFHGNIEKDCNAIREYFDAAFADMPASGGSCESKKYYSSAAASVFFLTETCHVPICEALDLPLKVLWQLMRVHLRHQDPKAILFNPSDALISRAVAAAN